MSEEVTVNSIFEGMTTDEANNVSELVHLGALSEDYNFCGHTFGLRTLRVDELLAVGVALKDYQDTAMQAQAWGAAHVAMALTHVDGDSDFCPSIGPDKAEFAKARMRWVTEKWYWPTINFLYERYADLLESQLKTQETVRDF